MTALLIIEARQQAQHAAWVAFLGDVPMTWVAA
jgi:hypothetical protein